MAVWLQASPWLILAAIFVVAFIESFALVGVIVPGVVFLFSLAALAQSTGIALWWVLLAAALGACLGDLSSFFIGYRLQHQLDRLAWVQRHRDWLAEGEWFFRRWGWLSVLIGRFVGPLRPVVPLIAGMLNMSPRVFVGLSIGSVIAWAPAYMLPGFIAGELVELMHHRSLAERSLIVTVLVATAGLLAFMVLYHHLHPQHPKMLQRWPWLNRLSPRLPFSSVMLAVTAGSALLWLILARPLVWDALLNAQVPIWRSGWADSLFVAYTLLGDPRILALTGLMFAFWFFLKGFYWLPTQLVVTIALAQWGIFELKSFFSVPRPTWVATLPPGDSFPSGHASAFALYIALAAAIANESRPADKRWQLYLPAGIVMLGMAFSRVWLGVHWLSDVLAGLALALFCAALGRLAYAQLTAKRFHLAGTAAFWWLIGLTFAAYLVLMLPQARLDYALG
ncbi:VTT domain-containing protein [Saccharospirillum mangrovi]|uniref:VTT domain-containing protein n=1 Tax=Saccharospirillum mangrovi TaxID=2161747 RepID=UPI000D35EA13|nr:VTT domain-containing protein [Saccharospirillum mangrovi]